MPNDKAEFDRDACSFVVRIWREKAAGLYEKGEWRGWIEHVQSGKRVSFRDKAVICSFINEYLYSNSEPQQVKRQ